MEITVRLTLDNPNTLSAEEIEKDIRMAERQIGWNYDYKIESVTVEKRKISAEDIDGLWCDDITFCQENCERKSCPRNKLNIRDKTVPHSFSVGIPSDCPIN